MATKELRTEVKIRERTLLLERRNHILIIKINRPQSRNALNRNAIYDLIAAFAEAKHNSDIHIVVLTGVGDFFSAGNDLKQIQDYHSVEDYNFGANYVLKSLIKSVMACPKLFVCLVNGPCIGIGFTLAALSDVVYCTRNAYFLAPFTRLGLCPEACSSYTFTQHFGPMWTSKLLMLGEQLLAENAQQLGFVTEIFENLSEAEEKFWPKLNDYADKLSWNSVYVTKRLIRQQHEPQLLAALHAELKEIQKLRISPAYKNAIKEFLQKSKSANKCKL